MRGGHVDIEANLDRAGGNARPSAGPVENGNRIVGVARVGQRRGVASAWNWLDFFFQAQSGGRLDLEVAYCLPGRQRDGTRRSSQDPIALRARDLSLLPW